MSTDDGAAPTCVWDADAETYRRMPTAVHTAST